MQEVEAKLLVEGPDRDVIMSELLSLETLAGFELRKPRPSVVAIADVYYDTPQQDLRRSAMSLRLREEGGVSKITLKSGGEAGGIHVRREMEEELDAGAVERILVLLAHENLIRGDLLESAMGRIDANPEVALRSCGLLPVARVENSRHKREVVDQGRTVAYFSVDDVVLCAAGKSEPRVEIEIEAVASSDSHAIREIATQLQRMYAHSVVPSRLSKYERALRLQETSSHR